MNGNPMWRRSFMTLLAGAAAWPLGVRAQQTGRMPIVGYLSFASEASTRQATEALRDGMRVNGYIDGENLRLLSRYADGNAERLPHLARELAAAGSRMIVTSGTTSVKAVQSAVPALPIVMAGSGDPVLMGFARSLARPGGNITGISIFGNEIIGKRTEILKDLVPSARTFALLLHAANPGNEHFRRGFAAAGQSLGLTTHVREADSVEGYAEAFAWAASLPVDGVFVIEDPFVYQHRETIFRMALAARLPTIGGTAPFAHAGALCTYGFDYLVIHRDSGRYVAEILRGADPGDLPIEQPTRFELVVNLKTAQALGITLPEAIMILADEVIE
mgnify:CR=1 FL=1